MLTSDDERLLVIDSVVAEFVTRAATLTGIDPDAALGVVENLGLRASC